MNCPRKTALTLQAPDTHPLYRLCLSLPSAGNQGDF
jgi:hypothetical protein